MADTTLIQTLEGQDSFEIYVGRYSEMDMSGHWDVKRISVWTEDESLEIETDYDVLFDANANTDNLFDASNLANWLEKQADNGAVQSEVVENSAGTIITRYWKSEIK